MDEKTQANLKRAWNYLQTNQPEQARLILVEVVRQDPKVDLAWYLLGFALPDRKQQILALERALSLNPGNEKVCQRLAKIRAENAAPPESGKLLQAVVPAPVAKKSIPRQKAPLAKRSRSDVVFLAGAVSSLSVTLFVVVGLFFLGYLNAGGTFPGRTPIVLVEPVSAPTFTFLPPTPSPMPRPLMFAPTICAFKTPQNVRVECGYVDVPEERGGDSPGSVRLMAAIYHSTSSLPAPDPVVLLHGGPGGDALQKIAGVYYYILPILEERDFIVFDQRGSGLSQPSLNCPELVEAFLQNLRTPFTAGQVDLQFLIGFQKCQNRLKALGVNLRAYTTEASAADVRDISAALGYKQINLLAYSYGTRVAQVVMRDYPELVRSAILDSVVPLEVKIFNQISYQADYALNTLFSNCAADLHCNTAFPDLEQVFYNQVERLDADPVEVEALIAGQSYRIKAAGSELVSAVIWGMRSTSIITYIPKAIYEVAMEDYSYLEAMSGYNLLSYGESLGVMTSNLCHEHVYATTPDKLADDLAAYPRLKNYAFAEIYGKIENLFMICDVWEAAAYDPLQSEPLRSSIPALILAGEYDAFTPPSYGEQLHAHLSASYFVEFPGMAHAVSLASASSCPRKVVLSFLEDPVQAPETTCLSSMKPMVFVLPFDINDVTFVPFTNGQYGIQGKVPKGWKGASYGQFNRSVSLHDTTQIGMQSSDTISTQAWLDYLMENYQSEGLDVEPKLFTQIKTKAFNWRLYRSEYQGDVVDIALAENGKGRTYAVIMRSEADERDQLLDAVYLPVILSLQPLD